MVKIIVRNTIWYALCTATLLDGKVGCMAIDKPVGKFDNKTYHFVQCNCPCTKMLETNRNYCEDCGHYHDQKPWIFVTEKEVAQATAEAKNRKKQAHTPRSPLAAVKQLVAKYRVRKAI